jgi:hypothetical protein
LWSLLKTLLGREKKRGEQSWFSRQEYDFNIGKILNIFVLYKEMFKIQESKQILSRIKEGLLGTREETHL